ncbi:hypothetical protein Droror1_Dr00022388, partial [Drosera rotundifolia]
MKEAYGKPVSKWNSKTEVVTCRGLVLFVEEFAAAARGIWRCLGFSIRMQAVVLLEFDLVGFVGCCSLVWCSKARRFSLGLSLSRRVANGGELACKEGTRAGYSMLMRAGYSRDDQYYASYPAGTELLTDTTKLYKSALGNVFEVDAWGPIEYCIITPCEAGS